MIAVTEVTRSYAEGNQIAWKESGVVEGKEWNTANDEIVARCPICWPLHGVVIPIGEEFDGGFDGPPAHPRCRCWITPVVIGDPEEGGVADRGVFTIADEIALIESGGFDDVFTSIRPPPGRAPRGLGQEYAQRRRIISRIQTQRKYRAQAEAQLQVYRGQTSHRLRWRIDVAEARVQELNKGIAAMTDIALDKYTNDWVFKNELIDGIIDFLSGQRI
jgi:hypothetical protein